MADAAIPTPPAISTFERYLSVWVILCIGAGIALGAVAPDFFRLIASVEVGAGQPAGGSVDLADDYSHAAEN